MALTLRASRLARFSALVSVERRRVVFDREEHAKGKRVPIPFGRQDCTVFRKVMSTEDTIQDFAPALRTGEQAEAPRISL